MRQCSVGSGASPNEARRTEKGFRVLFNGRPVVSFTDSRLGNMILEGFIGAHPPSEDLRAGLLDVPMN
jgi:hypothetical protein